MKTPHEKYHLSILLSISSTILSTACSVECDLRKPYCEEYIRLFLSLNSFLDSSSTKFSKILLKLDKRDIGGYFEDINDR